MDNWSELRLFDFETTGVGRHRDRPVQIGLIDGNGRVLMNTLVDPCMDIDKEASDVHGITRLDVAYHPDYLIGLWQMYQLIGLTPDVDPQRVLAGYNISQFDLPMALHCYKPDGFSPFVLDVLDLVYRLHPTLPSKKLSDVHLALTGEPLIGAHGAVQDCLGTLNVLRKLCEQTGLGPMQLSLLLAVPRPYEVMPIGKYCGKPISEVPKSWATYMNSNATDMRPDLASTVDHILNRT